MAENIQKIKTRYPFGGFYLELLPEAERKELESMPEEVLLPESKITTGLPDTMLPIKPSGVVQALRDEEAIARPVQRAVVEEDCTDDDDIGAYVRSLIQKMIGVMKAENIENGLRMLLMMIINTGSVAAL